MEDSSKNWGPKDAERGLDCAAFVAPKPRFRRHSAPVFGRTTDGEKAADNAIKRGVVPTTTLLKNIQPSFSSQ